MSESDQNEQLSPADAAAAAKAVARDLLINQGLYAYVSTESDLGQDVEHLLRKADLGVFDHYCTRCKRVTPFLSRAVVLPTSGGALRTGRLPDNVPTAFATRVICQRDSLSYIYVFHCVDRRIYKIGQHPSIGDISFGELREIDGSLDSLDRKELGTAIGLFSHDAAAGAFVYLRRVFERMIGRAHDRMSSKGEAIENFSSLRMHEKIDGLKSELPERVVRNSRVFSVLSAGIHELSDEQCRSMFPVVKAVIFQMLEEEEHRRRRAMADAQTDAALQALLDNTNPRTASAPRPSDNQA